MKYIALAGACPADAIKKLTELRNIEKVFVLPPDRLIDTPIKNHPDTILCIYNGKLYCHEDYAKENREILSEICSTASLELKAQSGERNGNYPFDCAFNALVIPSENAVIGRKKSLCPPLSEICENTNQGYAACSSLVINETVVTADPSIAAAAERLKIRCRMLSGGDIILPGYDTGFIGGCGGFFDNTLCLFGNPELTKTGNELLSFCRQEAVETISLCDGPLTDYGSVKFVPLL